MVSPMWTCPGCGRPFANRNQTHSCGPLGDVDRLFEGCASQVQECFERCWRPLAERGHWRSPERTRVAFQVRMSFAAFQPRRCWLDGHVVLARSSGAAVPADQVFSARNVLHAFRLHAPDEVDDEVAAWLAKAYRVGAQEHLR